MNFLAADFITSSEDTYKKNKKHNTVFVEKFTFLMFGRYRMKFPFRKDMYLMSIITTCTTIPDN